MTRSDGRMPGRLSRRAILAGAATAFGVWVATRPFAAAADLAPKRILLRSGWQSISLADLAQMAGDLAMLERHAPAARVTLWPAHLEEPAEQMLRRRFPKLEVV